MTHPNEELMREALAAFQRGDIEAVSSSFAEDIRYHVSGGSPISGDYEGIAQVLELFGRVFELSGGTFRIEVHDVLANDEHGVALLTVRAEREGRQLEDNQVLVSHLHDGKTAEVWVQSGDPSSNEEFWS